jgi:hypothetical protein
VIFFEAVSELEDHGEDRPRARARVYACACVQVRARVCVRMRVRVRVSVLVLVRDVCVCVPSSDSQRGDTSTRICAERFAREDYWQTTSAPS